MLGLNAEANISNLEKFEAINEFLKEVPTIPEEWLKNNQSIEEKANLYKKAKSKFDNYHKAKLLVVPVYKDDAWKLDVEVVFEELKQQKNKLSNILRDIEAYINELTSSNQPSLNAMKSIRPFLSELNEISNELCGVLGFDSSSITLGQIKDYKFIIEKLILRLNPTTHWLGLESFGKVKDAFVEAKKNILEYISDVVAFEIKYDAEVLDRPELSGMIDRFIMNYSSILRIFNSQYKKDKKIFQVLCERWF